MRALVAPPSFRAPTPGPLPQDFDPSGPAGDDGIFGLPCSADASAVVLLPVPWEATVSYRAGTASGPAAIARASQQVELYEPELGRPYEGGIALLDAHGDVRKTSDRARGLVAELRSNEQAQGPGGEAHRREVDACCGWLNEYVRAEVSTWLARGKLVGVLGGEHSVALGSIAAHGDRFGPMGVLHVDAHADLRVGYEGLRYSHASVMERVLDEVPAVSRLVSVGLRDLCEPEHERIREEPNRIRAFFDADIGRRALDAEPFARIAAEVAEALPRQVYLSFDIDGLDPQLCPNTGTPVPGGLSFHQAIALLRTLVRTGHQLVGFDLCEVAPGPADDEWDGNVAARLLYQIIGYARLSGRGSR